GAEYAGGGDAARTLLDGVGKAGDARKAEIATEHEKLRRRLDEIVDIDFLGAPGREAAAAVLASLNERLKVTRATRPEPTDVLRREEYQGRTWVTRKGIHVDRMASAWLIRRFIDDRPQFKFVPAKGYRPAAGELRFDMFEAEFTHEGDACTFEVLVQRFGLSKDAGLAELAELVHEVDV